MKRKINSMWRVVIVAVMVVSLGLVMAVPVSAAVIITPANSDVDADTFITAVYTDLPAIVITETAFGEIGEGTIILNVPTGFEFRTTPDPDVAVTGAELVAAFTSITVNQLTVTVTTASTTAPNILTIGGVSAIGVRPTQGKPLASGDIVMDGTSTSTIVGVTPGVDSFGLLNEVHGALDAYTVVPAAGPYTAGTAFDVTITAVDQFENPLGGADYVTAEPYTWATNASDAPDGTPPDIGTLVAGDFTDGVAIKSVTLYCAESGVTFTATDDNAITGTSDPPITVNPGSATLLVVSGITDPFIAGGTSGVTVEALDAYDNRATGYTGEIHFTSSDTRANVVLPADYTFVPATDNGIKVFDGTTEGQIVRLVTKGEQTVTATDTALTYITGTQADITVQVVTRPPSRIAPPVIETNLFGEVSTFSISETGEILETITATSEDGMLTITILEGTIALDKDGNPLSSLTANVDPSPPPPPSHIIGLAYDFGSDGASFDPPITLAWSYDPDALPEDVVEEDLVVECYPKEIGEWEECISSVDTITHTITVSVDHFTTFAIIAPTPADAPIPPALPAAFTSSSLSISPVEVDIGEAVSISTLVTNTGEEAGSYTITLKIDGVVEETKEIALAGGTSKTVTFTTAKDKAGTYSVDVDGLMGSFMVKAAPPPPPTPPPGVNWAILGPIIGVAVFLAIFLPVRIRRRRASR